VDYSLILFLIVVLYSGFRGYKSGSWKILARLVSLLTAYLIAYSFAQPFGEGIQSASSLKGLMSYIAAGIILFTISSSLLMLILNRLIKSFANPDQGISKLQAVSGGLLGVVFGVFTGFFFVWFFITLQAIYQTKKGAALQPPTAFQQTTKEFASVAIKKVVNSATQQADIAAASAALLSSPAENIEHFKRLTNSGLLSQFLRNPSAQSALDSNNAKAVLLHPAFQTLVKQENFVALSKQLDFSNQPEEMEKQVAIKITTLWAQINQVRNDPEFIRITGIPEIRDMIKSSNFFSMLNNEKIEQLLDIIYSAKIPEIRFDDLQHARNKTGVPPKKTEIHRWVDEDGKVHYSDKKQ